MTHWIARVLLYFGFVKTGTHTKRYYNLRYKLSWSKLNIGDNVWVKPCKNPNNKETGLSISRKKFKAKIQLRKINWVGYPKYELCTFVKGGHAAVINDYLFNRLEKIL